MKSSFDHIPGYKQEEIRQIANIIRQVVNPEMIILFGSYATGTWVEDEYFEKGIRYSYISDYDFLVVTKEKVEKEHLLQDQIVNRARNVTKIMVNAIIHDIGYVNEGLSFGQYFFNDIIKEGVVLYDSGNVQFTSMKELTKEEQKAVSSNYFKIWYNRGAQFFETAEFHIAKDYLNLAAFDLHQATESFYNTILLVFTGYKPKTHSLEKLRQYAKPYSKEVWEIFPESMSDQEYHLFDLLKRGYIDARYKQDYSITGPELKSLIEKVGEMKKVVEQDCKKLITE